MRHVALQCPIVLAALDSCHLLNAHCFTAEQQERNAYLRQKETERAAAALLLYPDV
jgi:hypothetical protein